jgi:hypothetical protein
MNIYKRIISALGGSSSSQKKEHEGDHRTPGHHRHQQSGAPVWNSSGNTHHRASLAPREGRLPPPAPRHQQQVAKRVPVDDSVTRLKNFLQNAEKDNDEEFSAETLAALRRRSHVLNRSVAVGPENSEVENNLQDANAILKRLEEKQKYLVAG